MTLDTTYIINGIIHEAVVEECRAAEKINQFNLKSMKLISYINEMAESAKQNAISSAPLGLTDQSIINRWNAEQRASSNAYDNFIRTNYPKVAKRLYRNNSTLYNYCVNCSIAALEQSYDELKSITHT